MADEVNDTWIDQLERDLVEVEDIRRTAESSRSARMRLITARAPEFFKQISKRAKSATDRLHLEFAAGADSFHITKRPAYARLDMTLNIPAQGIKAKYTRSVEVGAGPATESEECFNIRLDENDNLYVILQDGKPLTVSGLLERIFRDAFLPR